MKKNRSLLLVGSIWVVARAWVLFLLIQLPWVPYDVALYEKWSKLLLAGSFPVADSMWQYPDLVAAVLVLPHAFPWSYITNFVLVTLAVDALIMFLSLRNFRTRSGSIIGPVLWASAGFWTGPVLLTRLDLYPTLLAVLALIVTRPWLSAVFAGVGAGLKVWPAAIVAGWRAKTAVTSILILIATFGLTTLVVRLFIPEGDSFISNQINRGLQAESVGVLPYLIRGLFGADPTFIASNGTLEIVSSQAELIGAGLTLFGVVIVISITLLNWFGRLPNLHPADIFFTTVTVLIATNRVFSPQFYIWLAGLGSIALIYRASIVRIPMILIVLSSISAQYIYPLNSGLETAETDALIVQIIRLILFLVALSLLLFRIGRTALESKRSAMQEK